MYPLWKMYQKLSVSGKYGIDLPVLKEKPELAYHCFLCGTCGCVCPKGIDGKEIALDSRRKLVEDGGGKLLDNSYDGLLLEKNPYKFANYRHSKKKAVFFTGCNFPSFFPKTTDKLAKPEVMQACMKEILLLGTYIKRSANLYFLSQEYEKLPQQELRLTIDELVRAMNSCKIECGAVYLTTKPIASKEVVRLFELLKTVMEMTINELHSLFISVSDQEMNLSVECAADLSPIISSEVTVDKEDGLWLIRTAIGGEDNA